MRDGTSRAVVATENHLLVSILTWVVFWDVVDTQGECRSSGVAQGVREGGSVGWRLGRWACGLVSLLRVGWDGVWVEAGVRIGWRMGSSTARCVPGGDADGG